MGRDSIPFFLLALLFAIWVGIQAFRSPQPVRGLTMLLITLRDIGLLFIIATAVAQTESLRQMNRALFVFGTIFATISIVLFFVMTRQRELILADPRLWKPAIGYEVGPKAIRLMGLSGDSNFYSLWLFPSFACGLSVKMRPTWLKWAGIGVIGLSLFLALSRTFAIAFVTSSVFVVFLIVANPRIRKSQWPYAKSLIAGIFVAGAAALIWSHYRWNAFQSLSSRFEDLSSGHHRFEYWSLLLQKGTGNLFLGGGLRSAETLLEGMYSHNSYLDMLIETGLFGLLVWGALIFLVTKRGIKQLRHVEFAPWIHSWFLLMIMLLSFSLVYNPFFWMLAAVVAFWKAPTGSRFHAEYSDCRAGQTLPLGRKQGG